MKKDKEVPSYHIMCLMIIHVHVPAILQCYLLYVHVPVYEFKNGDLSAIMFKLKISIK